MRLLLLKEVPVLELQEANSDGYYLIALGNTIEMFYDPKSKNFFQFQEGPSNKEIRTESERLQNMDDKEKAEKEFQELKAKRKKESKKVLYKIIVDGIDYKSVIEKYIEEGITKEYLH